MKQLRLDYVQSKKARDHYSNGHYFFQKYFLHVRVLRLDFGYNIKFTDLSIFKHIYHLDLCNTDVIDVSMLDKIYSLDIFGTKVRIVSMLLNLGHLFIERYINIDTTMLKNTNIHYHDCIYGHNNDPIYHDKRCRKYECRIKKN